MTYIHPNRTSKNSPGDFYTTGYWQEGEESGDCLDCALPEEYAQDLMADIYKDDTYTHFIRQPTSKEEVEKACVACEVCCVSALRYGGKDISIIQRLGNNPEYCDYIIDKNKELQCSLNPDGELLPFAEKYVTAYYRRQKIKHIVSFGFIKVWWRKRVNKLNQQGPSAGTH